MVSREYLRCPLLRGRGIEYLRCPAGKVRARKAQRRPVKKAPCPVLAQKAPCLKGALYVRRTRAVLIGPEEQSSGGTAEHLVAFIDRFSLVAFIDMQHKRHLPATGCPPLSLSISLSLSLSLSISLSLSL